MLNMQVKSMMDTLDQYLADMASIDNIDDNDLIFRNTDNSDLMLSEDIWKKFGFDFSMNDITSTTTNNLDDLFTDIEAMLPDALGLSNKPDVCDMQIRNHDCMWAGHCVSKEHGDEHKLLLPFYRPRPAGVAAPGLEKTPAVKQQPVAAGRSLLLKTVIKAPPVPVLPSPESPPISDDEDTKGQTTTLKMLNDAIDECDIAEDSDLCEYFEGDDIVAEPEEDEDEEEQEEQEKEEPPESKPVFAAESDHSYHDHSYHKDMNASMRMTNLGIETPSDSEEEIDVVSVGEKQNVISNRLAYALPTNPSNRDRHQLQRTVASAITNNRRIPSGGIKTLPPVRKYSSGESTPTKRRLPETPRGVKRPKHYYRSSNQSTSKRRPVQTNSSDSEPESEKRSLHNNMERQRRIDLRNAFEDLRMLVPEVNSRDRAAKVIILREAAMYCDQLRETSESRLRKVEELRKKQKQLLSKVSRLRWQHRNLNVKP